MKSSPLAPCGHVCQHHSEAAALESWRDTRRLRDSRPVQRCWVLPMDPRPPVFDYVDIVEIRNEVCEPGVDSRPKTPTYGKLVLTQLCPKQTQTLQGWSFFVRNDEEQFHSLLSPNWWNNKKLALAIPFLKIKFLEKLTSIKQCHIYVYMLYIIYNLNIYIIFEKQIPDPVTPSHF